MEFESDNCPPYNREKKVIRSRFVRVILAQGPWGHANLLCIVPILSYETVFTPLEPISKTQTISI
jgi:hypothetical protein